MTPLSCQMPKIFLIFLKTQNTLRLPIFLLGLFPTWKTPHLFSKIRHYEKSISVIQPSKTPPIPKICSKIPPPPPLPSEMQLSITLKMRVECLKTPKPPRLLCQKQLSITLKMRVECLKMLKLLQLVCQRQHFLAPLTSQTCLMVPQTQAISIYPKSPLMRQLIFLGCLKTLLPINSY